MLLMFIGACAGSTGGGMKCSRILLLFKGVKKEMMSLIPVSYTHLDVYKRQV